MAPLLRAIWEAANSPAAHTVYLGIAMLLYPGPCG
jgi:hypothetical protein